MIKKKITPRQWAMIHPKGYVNQTNAYLSVADELLATSILTSLSPKLEEKIAIAVVAYIEDLISGLGLWESWVQTHKRMYGKYLPFYEVTEEYIVGEPNKQDLAFLVWHYWYKGAENDTVPYPLNETILKQAELWYPVVERAYEELPENTALSAYFSLCPTDINAAEEKLWWLHQGTYLTAPSMWAYNGQYTVQDMYMMPTGPLALFLYEWIGILSSDGNWQLLPNIRPQKTEERTEEMRIKNRHYYDKCLQLYGNNLVCIDNYDALQHFFHTVCEWKTKEGEEGIFSHLKDHRNFVLLLHPEKGILLKADICEAIYTSSNELYDKAWAEQHAFLLLTKPYLCAPDLLKYLVGNDLLPDACFPQTTDNAIVKQHADFIARHALLYFYREDD